MSRLFIGSLLFLATACGNMQSPSTMNNAPLPPRADIPKIILFFAWPFSPLEGCINGKIFPQPPDGIPMGYLRGPVGMTRDANGAIIPHIAQTTAASGDERNPTLLYKVRFITADPQGWRVSMINNAIGVYSSSLEPQVQILNLDDTPAFQVDISTCLPPAPAAPHPEKK